MTHTLPRPGVLLLPYPDPFRPNFSGEDVLALLDYQFETTCPPHQVAAVFIEPLMSDGGLIVPPPGFLKALQERCRKHGIKIVVDEVKVGLARSGMMHCFQHEGLTPDLVVFGKGIGGGLPLSAVVGPKEPDGSCRRPSPCRPAGNPVAYIGRQRGAEDDRQRRPGRYARLADRQTLSDALRGLPRHTRSLAMCAGGGLAIGVDLVKDRATAA